MEKRLGKKLEEDFSKNTLEKMTEKIFRQKWLGETIKKKRQKKKYHAKKSEEEFLVKIGRGKRFNKEGPRKIPQEKELGIYASKNIPEKNHTKKSQRKFLVKKTSGKRFR